MTTSERGRRFENNCSFIFPNQALYQAEPQPEFCSAKAFAVARILRAFPNFSQAGKQTKAGFLGLSETAGKHKQQNSSSNHVFKKLTTDVDRNAPMGLNNAKKYGFSHIPE